MVEYLIQFGCVINASDKKDRRALHFAAYNGHYEIVKVLIARDADVNVKVTHSLRNFRQRALGHITSCVYFCMLKGSRFVYSVARSSRFR